MASYEVSFFFAKYYILNRNFKKVCLDTISLTYTPSTITSCKTLGWRLSMHRETQGRSKSFSKLENWKSEIIQQCTDFRFPSFRPVQNIWKLFTDSQ